MDGTPCGRDVEGLAGGPPALRQAGGSGIFGAEGFGDAGGDEFFDGAVQGGDFADEGGGDGGVFFARHEEEGLNVGGEFAVGEGHLELVLEVAEGAQAADEGSFAVLARPLDEEAGEGLDVDVGEVGDGAAGEVEAFFGAEEDVLAGSKKELESLPLDLVLLAAAPLKVSVQGERPGTLSEFAG